jgi:spore germination protein YaaH
MQKLLRILLLMLMTICWGQPVFAAPGKTLSKKSAIKPRITTLMYLVNRSTSVESFEQHADQVSIIAPQCFTMDAEGFVGGEVPPAVLEVARQHKVALMPLVTNRGFKQDLMHTVLDTPASRMRVIRYLLFYALRDGYIGFQFDFENIKYTYRDRFTAFFREAAREFHRHHLLLSAAVVGKYSEDRDSESPGGFENWSGVYDYRAMAKDADFLSIMAYPQHAGFSGPGPIAGLPWVTKIADFTLSNMPARKVSLGVPLYGVRWTAVDNGTTPKADFVQDNEGGKDKKWKTSSVSWPQAIPELQKTHQAAWDETEQAHWFDLSDNGTRAVAWYEDAKSLAPKLKLAADRKLGWGVSGWVMGQEDPEFWTMLSNNYRVTHPKTPQVAGTEYQRAFGAARQMHGKNTVTAGEQAAGK